jgi:hypothetical protein
MLEIMGMVSRHCKAFFRNNPVASSHCMYPAPAETLIEVYLFYLRYKLLNPPVRDRSG